MRNEVFNERTKKIEHYCSGYNVEACIGSPCILQGILFDGKKWYCNSHYDNHTIFKA